MLYVDIDGLKHWNAVIPDCSLCSPLQNLYENSFTGVLPTQIGLLTKMVGNMVSQGPSAHNDKHTDNINESSYQSH